MDKQIKEDIEIRHLYVSFKTAQGQITAVEDLSLRLKEKRITGLVGESGSGKSVLGMSILNLLPSTAIRKGECWLQGKNLFQACEKEMCQIRGKKIALIPQNPNQSLNPSIKIGPQLCEAVKIRHKQKNPEAYIIQLLKELGLDSPDLVIKKYAFEMSGGMNQRIVSVLGMCGEPQWIIADEPTKGLDAVLRKQVYQVLKAISEKRTKSILVITHDLILAYKLCQDICVLYGGQIVEQGNAKDVLERPMHPYTRGLLNSLPSMGMNPVPGQIREKAEHGCIFYSRCPNALEQCKERKPSLYPVQDRSVRCVLYA